MKLTIDYTDGFEKSTITIGEEKEHSDIDALKKNVECLAEQYNSLLNEFKEIKELLTAQSDMNGEPTENSPKTNSIGKPHISTYRHYDNYKLERKYDKKKGRFFVSENRRPIELNFLQLVAIIKGYKNGLSTNKIKVNPILSQYTTYSIQDYIYIWRAGGFNQAIKDHAREFGYNPNKLLSDEVE